MDHSLQLGGILHTHKLLGAGLVRVLDWIWKAGSTHGQKSAFWEGRCMHRRLVQDKSQLHAWDCIGMAGACCLSQP